MTRAGDNYSSFKPKDISTNSFSRQETRKENPSLQMFKKDQPEFSTKIPNSRPQQTPAKISQGKTVVV